MFLLKMKQIGVLALAAVNLVLLVMAVVAARQRRPVPAVYYKVLPASLAIALLQLSVGVYFVLEGQQPHLQHVLYGILVGVGGTLQFLLRPGSASGQRYRNRPLVHAVLALFVVLVGLRSWMTG